MKGRGLKKEGEGNKKARTKPNKRAKTQGGKRKRKGEEERKQAKMHAKSEKREDHASRCSPAWPGRRIRSEKSIGEKREEG